MGRKHTGKRGFGVREGDVVGYGGTVIDANVKADKHGHRFVSVFWDHPRTCPHCHGQAKVARADKLRSGADCLLWQSQGGRVLETLPETGNSACGKQAPRR